MSAKAFTGLALARALVRRWGTDSQRPGDSDELKDAVQALWPDEEDATAMRDILLPECVMMAGNSWWCALDEDATACGRDARLVPVRSASSVEYSLVTQRRWPTCEDCRALLLECREWMPEWWTVEPMADGEASAVLGEVLPKESDDEIPAQIDQAFSSLGVMLDAFRKHFPEG